MVPTALKLPLWNGPPIFLTHLGSQESKKTEGDLVRREDTVPPNFGPWETDYIVGVWRPFTGSLRVAGGDLWRRLAGSQTIVLVIYSCAILVIYALYIKLEKDKNYETIENLSCSSGMIIRTFKIKKLLKEKVAYYS